MDVLKKQRKISIQNSINTPDEIDRDKLKLFLEERNMVQVDDLSIIKKMQRISYITVDFLFRTGGVVIKNEEDYFVIKCFNGIFYSLQKNTIEECFVGDIKKPKKKEKPPSIIWFNPIGEVTKFPLIIDGVLLKYFDKKSRYDAFLQTEKYRKLMTGAKWDFKGS